MKISSETFDKIEKYLANRLSDKDRIAFKKAMDNDPDLYLEVERHRELHEVLRDKKTLKFKKELQSIQQEFYEEEQKEASSKKFNSYLKWAAVLVVLFGLGLLLWTYLNSQKVAEDLFTEYYEPYPVFDGVRTEETNDFSVIIKHYAKSNYIDVISAFETSNKELSLSDELKLYVGTSYLHASQTEKAVTIFKSISKDSGFYEDALWYLALTHLKNNENEASILVLENVIAYNGRYNKKAIELMKKITGNP